MNASKLTARIQAAVAAGRKALIPYLPAGFPDKERFWQALSELDAHGADIIEIGVPFSDPVADGPVVEQAALDCLNQGVTLSWIIQELTKRRASLKAEIVLMGYMNPFYQYGLAKFAIDAAKAGVAGCIIPDLPYEESGEFKPLLAAAGLDLISLVGLNTPPERLALYANNATGFVYFVSVLGTTGERADLPGTIKAKLKEVRAAFRIPIALGFGIKTPEQLDRFKDDIDAAVFGSALITHIRGGGTASEFMARWK